MTSSFHFPEGQNYVCVRCGKSCEFDETPVEEESRGRLEAVPYKEVLPPELREKPVIVPSPTGGALPTLAKSCGACVFLTADRLCGLHARFGPEAKPLTCHEFPFRYVEAPGGVYVGLSFACTAVLQNVGPPVAEQAAELEAGHARSKMILRRKEPVRLTNRHELSWAAYELLEQDLQTILSTSREEFGLRLVAQSVYLDLLVALLRQVRGDAPIAGEGRQTTPAPFKADSIAEDAEVVLTVRKKFLADGGESLFRLAARGRASPALHRAFIGLITAFRQSLQLRAKRPGRLTSAVKIFRHYLQHSMKLGRVRLDAVEKPFDYAAFARVKEDWTGSREDLLRRFFGHVIFRKDLLLSENVWLGQRFLLMQYALIRWHAVGMASVAGETEVTEEVLREAVACVERQYVFHANFAKLFEDTPMLGMLLDGIVRKPSYASAMAGAVV